MSKPRPFSPAWIAKPLRCGLAVVSLVFAGASEAQTQAPQTREIRSEERSNVNLFRRTSPSVVNICTKTAVIRRSSTDVSMNVMAIPSGSGTGFVWDSAGHIVTNHHVVRDADAAQVTFADGSVWNAELVGVAPQFDIAVLRVDAPAEVLQPLAVGRSDDLQVGLNVYAIGNPFGLDHTLTTGIISGLGREIESQSGMNIMGVIQTDAAINPGNSGGPLLDSGGQLIGMNTAILSRSGSSSGIGFAVPVDTIRRAVPQLIESGRAQQVGLGINIAPPQVAERFGVSGALILAVKPESPAERAGILSTHFDDNGQIVLGDIIVSINGTRVVDGGQLESEINKHKAGEVLTVGIKRNEDFARLSVPLAAF